ncbi:MAG: BolA family protein [Nanoarchaeota archaeon]
MVNSEELKEQIEKEIPKSNAKVEDTKNDGMHFKAVVKSSAFKNKPLVEQHRMVYRALGNKFEEGLHSMSVETKEE